MCRRVKTSGYEAMRSAARYRSLAGPAAWRLTAQEALARPSMTAATCGNIPTPLASTGGLLPAARNQHHTVSAHIEDLATH